MTVLVTGGAAFIGSNFVLDWCEASNEVVNIDALTCADNLENLAAQKDDPRHCFIQGDVCDRALALQNKGPVKVENFWRNCNTFDYAYLPMPREMKEELRLTRAFLARKEAEFEVLRATIAQLRQEVPSSRSVCVAD